MNRVKTCINGLIGRNRHSLRAAQGTGLSAGHGQRHKTERSGGGSSRSPVRRSLLTTAIRRWGRALFCGIALLLAAGSGYGYEADNIANLTYSYGGSGYTMNSNTARATVTPPASTASLELLRYGADPAGTPLPATDYSTTVAPGSFIPLTPLPGPGQLTVTGSYNEGELLVIRVSDSDMNIDPFAVDSVEVTLTDGADSELLLLRETGADSGIFLGYSYSGAAPLATYNGYLTAPAGSILTASYDDGGTTASISANILAPPAGGNGLWLQLDSDRSLVTASDIVTFSLTVENSDSTTATAVTLSQQLPAGFRYQAGSATYDGSPGSDPLVSSSGESLDFSLGDMASGARIEVTFRAMAGAIAPGSYPSSAVALAASGQFSNRADTTLRVRDELGNGKGIIAGRVVSGCGDAEGVEGVRIFLEDGTFVLTDKLGRYHVEGIEPGSHVLQLDPITLPAGFEPSLCEDHSRFAGNPASRFVELQPGSLWRADFFIADKPINGEVSIALDNSYDIGRPATYTVTLNGRDLPLSRRLLEIELPEAATYLPGSSQLSERGIDDPTISGRKLTYPLADRDGDWQETLTLRTFIDDNSETGEMGARARLHFATPAESELVTPDAESTLIWISRGERAEVQQLLLRPHFGTLDAVLTETDLNAIDDAVARLKQLDLIKIFVIGHTDARRIRWNDGVLYRDNFELSEARAEAVARRLQQQLQLDETQLVVVGLGAADPIADNSTSEGMALNRRTELRVLHRVVINPEMDKVDAIGGSKRTISPSGAPLHADSRPALPHGIVAPASGQNLAHSTDAVRVRIDARLTPRLSLDGVEIPEKKIGFRIPEPASGTVLLTYVGVNFGAPGAHTLKIEGVGPFGNSRYSDSVTVNRTGDIARLELIESSGNVADGRSPVRIRLAMFDQDGREIPAGTKLEIRKGELRPRHHDGRPSVGSAEERLIDVSNAGVVEFAPVNTAGRYSLVLGIGDTELETAIQVAPEKREWILVGLGSGTAGYNAISGQISPLDPNAPREDYYSDGRLAFFARGEIRGDWLLTLAYDSDREDRKNRSLQQVIDPERYYTVYGDSTEQGYAAASAEKLFVRIEREHFYTLFGDIETGLDVTELGRYTRSFTGLKSEWQGERVGYSAFISETAQRSVRDELPGDGTSGLYRLSSSAIIENSETVIIETRDRFHSEKIVDRRPLQRHLDYDIDYGAGSLYFKEPIQSRDRDFNPVFITISYETAGSSEDYTYGGRIYTRSAGGNLEIGTSFVNEDEGTIENRLLAFDTSIRMGERTSVKGEWARSATEGTAGSSDADAWLAEISHRGKRFELGAYLREQQSGFGLGQQNASEAATRKQGGEFRYHLTERLGLDTEFSRQENLDTGDTRNVSETEVSYAQEHYRLNAGIRHAEDRISGSSERSEQATFGADYRLSEKIDLTLRHEQSLNNNDNRDYPNRTRLGANYRLNANVTLFAEQELTDGEQAETGSTRLGMDARPWDGAQVRTSMQHRFDEAGRRLFGNLGLLQSWQVTPKLAISASLDQSTLISGQNSSSIHPDQPPVSGSAEDYIATSFGFSFREKSWSLDNRVEFRNSDSEDKWSLFAGSIIEPQSDLGLSLHGRHFHSKRADMSRSLESEISFGLAWRPDNRTWLLLNRFDLVSSENGSATTASSHWKVVERLNAFWRANQNNRLTFKLGARYASDKYDDLDYAGTTWLFGTEWRHDLSSRFDIGLHGSMLTVQELSQERYHAGGSVGYSPANNVWLSLGYNLAGYRDEDFSAADYTAQGPYIRFRVKFDQNSLKDALGWLRRQ